MSPIQGRLGNYELIEAIGEGAMGEVYKARDTKMFDRAVAIKVLPERYTKSEAALERFRREIQIASALQHPNIVTIHDHGALESRMYYVMEFIDGVKLSRLVTDPGFRSFRERLEIAVQICAGLQFIHQANIVHRDLKPGNIMVVRHGARDQVKLLDFGIALTEESNLTRSDAQPGTSSYMSPEQARGQSIDAQSDIFSLGIVLYELFTGRHPFAAASESLVTVGILQNHPQPLRELRPDLPVELSDIIARALDKDPHRRPASAGEIETILDWIRNRQLTADTGPGQPMQTGDFLPQSPPTSPSTFGGSDHLDIAQTTLPPEEKIPLPDFGETGGGTMGSSGQATDAPTATDPAAQDPGAAPVDATDDVADGGSPGGRKRTVVLVALIGIVGVAMMAVVFSGGWRQVQRLATGDPSAETRPIDDLRTQLDGFGDLPCDDRAGIEGALARLATIRQRLVTLPLAEADVARVDAMQSEIGGLQTAAAECLTALDAAAINTAIESVIERWRAAYEARSAERILEVYPGLEDAEGMRGSFSKMTRLRMTTEDLQLSHDGSAATEPGQASADCVVRMVFRNEGAAQDTEMTIRSHFELARDAGGEWTIVRQEFVS